MYFKFMPDILKYMNESIFLKGPENLMVLVFRSEWERNEFFNKDHETQNFHIIFSAVFQLIFLSVSEREILASHFFICKSPIIPPPASVFFLQSFAPANGQKRR